MFNIIPLTTLDTGDTISSSIISVDTDEFEYIVAGYFQKTSRESARVRVSAEDCEKEDGRLFRNFYLQDDDIMSDVLHQIPNRIRFTVECMAGSGKFHLEGIERPLPTLASGSVDPNSLIYVGVGNSIEYLPPPLLPDYFLGTDALGTWGYFPFPVVGAPHNHIDKETPVGAINGANRVFTLAQAPNPPDSLMLVKNGIVMDEGVGNDFVLSGLTFTYAVAQTPLVGHKHIAWYRTVP